MSLNLERFTGDPAVSKQIKKIFLEAFPREERPPYCVLKRRAKKASNVDFYGIFDGERLIGLAYIVRDVDSGNMFHDDDLGRKSPVGNFTHMSRVENFTQVSQASDSAQADRVVGSLHEPQVRGLAYLFFLALKKEERSKGCGTEIMRLLIEKYKDSRFFLALEQLDERAANYEERLRRHKFYERCGLKDMPYLIKEASVTYAVMGTGGRVQPAKYKKMTDEYLGFFRHFIPMELLNV